MRIYFDLEIYLKKENSFNYFQMSSANYQKYAGEQCSVYLLKKKVSLMRDLVYQTLLFSVIKWPSVEGIIRTLEERGKQIVKHVGHLNVGVRRVIQGIVTLLAKTTRKF